MATEIERKFTVSSDEWRQHAHGQREYRQGYLANDQNASVRIRIDGDRANLNIKSATLGITRSEYEYPLPLADAEEMLTQLCAKPLIEKTRYFVDYGGKTWEIDVFHGDNAGLVVAEVELESADEAIELPPWVDRDVSDDPRYYNVCLVKHPFKDW